MAIDHQPPEDHVDDLNLFSVFVRAPIIGTLTWILGGDVAKQEEDRRHQTIQALPEDNADVSTGSRPRKPLSKPGKSALRKAAPDLMGSQVSHMDEFEVLSDSEQTVPESLHGGAVLLTTKKKLSWSDESGHNLVEYMQESTRIEPVTAEDDSVVKPVQPAMTRSRSVRHANKLENPLVSSEIRYLPRGLDRAHDGIIMPVGPYGSSALTSTADSPQWGWYTNITPPTPEMHHSRPEKKGQDTSSNVSENSENSSAPVEAKPNRVFQDLQEKNRTALIGWSTGVPL